MKRMMMPTGTAMRPIRIAQPQCSAVWPVVEVKSPPTWRSTVRHGMGIRASRRSRPRRAEQDAPGVTNLNDERLQADSDHDHANEQAVAVKARPHVPVVADRSRVELVEHLRTPRGDTHGEHARRRATTAPAPPRDGHGTHLAEHERVEDESVEVVPDRVAVVVVDRVAVVVQVLQVEVEQVLLAHTNRPDRLFVSDVRRTAHTQQRRQEQQQRTSPRYKRMSVTTSWKTLCARMFRHITRLQEGGGTDA